MTADPNAVQVEDIFQGPVFAGLVKNYLYSNLALVGASPYVVDDPSVQWSGGGDTVTIPKFNGKITMVDLPRDGSCPDAQRVTMGSDTATVVGKYAGIQIPTSQLEDAYRDGRINWEFFGAIAENVGEAALDAVDQILIAKAEATTLTPVTCAVGGVPTYDDVMDARGRWGDKLNIPSMLVLHSTPYIAAAKSSDVKTFSTSNMDVMRTGSLPGLAGVPVAVSDNIGNDGSHYKNILIRRGGIRYSMKRTLTYKKVPIPGDQDLHEFTFRMVAWLDKANTLPGTVLIKSAYAA